MRFNNAVHTYQGNEAEKVAEKLITFSYEATSEKEKIAAAKLLHPRPPSMPIPSCFTCKAKRRPMRRLLSCACNTRTYFCNKNCQIDGWPKHKVACKRAHKRKKLDYSKEKMLVGELLSVAMRGGGNKGVLGTILSYV